MRDEPVDVLRRYAGLGENVLDDVGDHPDRMLEDFLSLHPQVPDRSGRRGSTIHEQLFPMRAIGTKRSRKNAAVLDGSAPFLRLEHHSSRTIAEENGCRAVAPVENTRKRFRADNQDT